MKLTARFEPRDIWVGLFWDRRQDYTEGGPVLHVYVCPIPCVVIHWRSA